MRVSAACAVCGTLLGCASTGPPRPPSLHLPQVVRDLAVQRYGDHVDVRFTVPTLSTDRQGLAAGRHRALPLRAEVCRQQGAAPCAVAQAEAVEPGQAVLMKDALPDALLHGAPGVLRYRVTLLNAQGRSAGPSREADTLSGAAPGRLQGLAATTSARGIQLTWVRGATDDGTRIVLQTGPQARTLTVDGDPGGTVDPTPKVGQAVTYTAVRTRRVTAAESGTASDIVVNGEPATVTVTRAPDTFAPAAPTGLVAVGMQMEGQPARIDLSWEPNTEPDLAGYLVFRAEGGGSPMQLTPSPVEAVSFADTGVEAGHSYSYVVRAVDAAGNRSAASAPATESLRP